MKAVEKLARLNPANVKFDTGRGGLPDLTPQDIAAAVAFVPAGLGRELLLVIGWPDGGRIHEVMRMATELACAELNRQHEAATLAGIRHSLAQWEAAGHRRRVEPAPEPGIRWPRNATERLPAIIAGCIRELGGPNLCATCGGHGQRMFDALLVSCPACGGSGRVPVSDRARADLIGVDEAAYRRNGWRDVYAWMHSRMGEAFTQAARRLEESLRT